MADKQVIIRDLGNMPYSYAWKLQEQLFKGITDIKLKNRGPVVEAEIPPNYFLLVEHPPVITLGRNAEEKNMLFSEAFLQEKGVEVFHINRGGDITFHGPGQLVGYPILDLDQFGTDIGKYLRNVEEVIIRVCADYGIVAGRIAGVTGVWLDGGTAQARKICAIGIRASRWITMHGFAFNVNTDLNYFNYIVPCGITDKGVTSLQKELGREVDMEKVKEKVLLYFREVFNCNIRFVH
ncbi:MAG: lipoyl(octanoyl) transferase LipB [Chitinophagales bacterium]